MKKLLLLLFIIQFGSAQSQTYPEYFDKSGDTSFTGYCKEYLDIRLRPVLQMSEARFSRYIYCVKGEFPVAAYPWDDHKKTDRILVNGVDVTDKDTVMFLDGLVQVKTKEGILYDEFYYKNGFIQKYVNRNNPYRKRQIGKAIWDMAEYDYSIFPFKRHVISRKIIGSSKTNCYEYFVSNKCVHEPTTDPISETILVK